MPNLRKLLSYSDARQFCEDNIATLKRLYLDQDMTAKKVAENQNIHYDNNFQKALLRVVGSKNKGLGGPRPGSGNKKGIRFCGKCRQKLNKCKCNQ